WATRKGAGTSSRTTPSSTTRESTWYGSSSRSTASGSAFMTSTGRTGTSTPSPGGSRESPTTSRSGVTGREPKASGNGRRVAGADGRGRDLVPRLRHLGTGGASDRARPASGAFHGPAVLDRVVSGR